MTEHDHLKNLSEIRSLMEQSSRFISLSGLSGVFAGIWALIGSAVVFWKFDYHFFPYREMVYTGSGMVRLDYVMFLIIVASVVLLLAFASGILFTTRRAKKQGHPIWNTASQRMLFHLAVPLVTGGIFCLVLLYNGVAHLVAPATLIFYGLALINGGKYTLRDIRYLGGFEIILGLIAAVVPGYALLFWAIGFGVLHIVYGLMMYYKYEK